jgi:hypothetical protein
VKLSKEMTKRIHRMANITWDVISGDILTLKKECGEKPILTKDEVVDCVCDASYMMYHGGDKEAFEVWDGIKNYKEQTKIISDAFTFNRYGW